MNAPLRSIERRRQPRELLAHRRGARCRYRSRAARSRRRAARRTARAAGRAGSRYSERNRAAPSIRRSMRSSVVLDRLRSALTRASIAARARVRVHQVGGEAVERVEPVVVAGNREDRLVDALQRQVEVRLVVLHRADRIDHVRRDHDELHRVAARRQQQLVAQARAATGRPRRDRRSRGTRSRRRRCRRRRPRTRPAP